MSDLEAAYLAKRQFDPEEADYQARLDAAKHQDSAAESLKAFGKDVVALGRPDHQARNTAVAAWDMLRNTGEMILDVARGAGEVMANSPPVEQIAPTEPPKHVTVASKDLKDVFPQFIGAMDAAKARANANATGTDIFFQKAVQFAIPFSAAVKGLNATNSLGTAANFVIADGAVSASVWEPHEGRFADLLNEVAPDGYLIGPAIDYLASNPADSDAEGRFKNVLDSYVAGGLLWSAGKLLRSAKSMPVAAQAAAAGTAVAVASKPAQGADKPKGKK